MTSPKLRNGDSATELFSSLTSLTMSVHGASGGPPPDLISSSVWQKRSQSPGSHGHHAAHELPVSIRAKNQRVGSNSMLELGSVSAEASSDAEVSGLASALEHTLSIVGSK